MNNVEVQSRTAGGARSESELKVKLFMGLSSRGVQDVDLRRFVMLLVASLY